MVSFADEELCNGTNHKWQYYDKSYRKCKCGRKEIFIYGFGIWMKFTDMKG